MKTFFCDGIHWYDRRERDFCLQDKKGARSQKKNAGLKKHCASCVALYMIYKSALRKLRCASLISETRCTLVRCALLISKTSCALVRCALLTYGKIPTSAWHNTPPKYATVWNMC